MKILLIEDQLELSDNITEFLASVGISCEACSNCFDAQDKLLVNTYDSIVLDIMLPDGSGLELIDLIKKNQTKSNILIISAKGSLGDKNRKSGIRSR